jgi:hypothetical protein
LVVSVAAYSSVPSWAQECSVALSGLAFAFLFLPVGFDDGSSISAGKSLRALLRFPLFWLGLGLLLLMLVQGLNPSLGVVQRTFYWGIYPMETPPVPWLPSGVNAPFDSDVRPWGMNAFREMLIFGGPWLLLCALWVGVERRRTLVTIAWVLLIVALVLVAWGSEMRIEGKQVLTGRYTMRNSSFFGTFLYQNQAGAWLSLMVGVALALGVWHWNNAAERFAQSGPHLLCAAIAVCLVLGAVCTLSFGGMLTISVLLLLVLPVAVLWGWVRNGVSRGVVFGGAVASVLLLTLVGVFYASMDLKAVEGKLLHKFKLVSANSLDDRAPLRRVTWAMIEHDDYERVWTGYGAGSYRWVGRGFFQADKSFSWSNGQLRSWANYAHCDWLQMLMEWGVAGMALVVSAFGWMAWFLLRNAHRWTPVSLVLVCAVLLFMGHATMDFLNYSMPILGLVAFATVGASRWGFAR